MLPNDWGKPPNGLEKLQNGSGNFPDDLGRLLNDCGRRKNPHAVLSRDGFLLKMNVRFFTLPPSAFTFPAWQTPKRNARQ
jgi:hypothetical protein